MSLGSAHYPMLSLPFFTGQWMRSPFWEFRCVLCWCSCVVLEERLAVMDSIHLSESYTALLSFSVKLCLRGLPGPALFPRWVSYGWTYDEGLPPLECFTHLKPSVQANTKTTPKTPPTFRKATRVVGGFYLFKYWNILASFCLSVPNYIMEEHLEGTFVS